MARLAERLQEDNRRLVEEVAALRQTVARLQQDLMTRTQLLGLWRQMHGEHRSWLASEIERLARPPAKKR